VALTPGVKRPRCEADQLRPSSAEVKNAFAVSTLFMVWCLIKQETRLHAVLLS